MLKSLKIRTKLLAGFLLISLLVTITGYTGIQSVQQISGYLDSATKSDAPSIEALLEIKSIVNEIEAQIVSFELYGGNLSREEGTLVGEKKSELIVNVANIESWLDKYERAISGEEPSKAAFIKELNEKKDNVLNKAFDLLGLLEKGISGERLTEKSFELNNAKNDLKGVIAKGIEAQLKDIEEKNRIASLATKNSTRLNLIVTAITFISALFGGFLIAQSISRPIAKLIRASIEVGKGNLETKVDVKSSDETGDLARTFNHMLDNLNMSRVKLQEYSKMLENKGRELESKVSELERFNRLSVGRELKMIELKKRIRELEEELGKKGRK